MSSRLRCELICEDEAQEGLFRPILEQMFGRGRVRVAPRKPQGGITFVLRQVAVANRSLRMRPQEKVGALLVVDGDAIGLQGRLAEIKRNVDDKSVDERLVCVVPSRTVETWALWLCGRRDLDENSNYKDAFRHERERGRMSLRQAAKRWFEQRSPSEVNAEIARLPALVHGRDQLSILKNLADRR